MHLQEASSHHFGFSESDSKRSKGCFFYVVVLFSQSPGFVHASSYSGSVLSPDKVKNLGDRGGHLSGL